MWNQSEQNRLPPPKKQENNIKEMWRKRGGPRFKDSKPYFRKWNKETNKIIKRADSLIYNMQWAICRFSIVGKCKKENIHDIKGWWWLLLLLGKQLTFQCPSFIVLLFTCCPVNNSLTEQRLKIHTPTPFTPVKITAEDRQEDKVISWHDDSLLDTRYFLLIYCLLTAEVNFKSCLWAQDKQIFPLKELFSFVTPGLAHSSFCSAVCGKRHLKMRKICIRPLSFITKCGFLQKKNHCPTKYCIENIKKDGTNYFLVFFFHRICQENVHVLNLAEQPDLWNLA